MKSPIFPHFARLRAITALVPALIAATFMAVSSASAEEIEVFEWASPADEEGKAGFASDSILRVEPAKDKPLRLRLRDLPEHQFLKIDALLDINETGASSFGIVRLIGGVVPGGAGAPAKNLRGRLEVAVDGAEPVINSSFGGQMGAAAGGSFPDLDGHFLHLPGTGSAHGPLELADKGGRIRLKRAAGADAEKLREHRVTFIIPHTGDKADLEIRWQKPGRAAGAAVIAIAGGAGKPSAPFSVKNLTASVLTEPVPLDTGKVSQQFEALGAANAPDAIAALNSLVAAGRDVIPMLGAELNREADPDLKSKFAEALKGLDDPSFEKRAAAAKSLADMRKEAIPHIRKALSEDADALSAEVKKSLEDLAERLEKGSGAVADNARTNRLRRLLDILGGEEATKLKNALPEPQLVIDPALKSVIKGAKAGAPGVIEMDFGGIKGADGAGGAIFKFDGLKVEGGLKLEAGAGGVKVEPVAPEPKK